MMISCDEARDLAAGYVLDALEPEEAEAVRAHLATCAEPHPEFATLGSVVPALLELDPSELVEPPAALRDRIMAAAAADSRGQAAAAADSRAQPPSGGIETTPAPRRSVEPIPVGRAADRTRSSVRPRLSGTASRWDWGLRIAAVLAIVAVGAWGLNLQGQLDRAHAFDRAIAAVVQAAGQPGAKTAILNAQRGFDSTGIAAVQPDGSVLIAMVDLPATSGGQVYTAWVIVGSNAPVPVGDFPVGSGGPQALTTRPATTPAGATIALTLEPNPGNNAPKGPIVSAGVAAAPPGAAG
jgi:Anti-sigma-K factor rskA/Putative zinc-finger